MVSAMNQYIFEQTFNQAAVGMVHLSLDGRLLNANNTYCEILHYNKKEIINLSFQDLIHPMDLKMGNDYIEKIITGKIQNYSLTRRYIRKNGEIIWGLTITTLIKDNKDVPLCLISILIDVTEKIKIQEELKLLSAELEQRVSQRTDALKKAIEQLNFELAQKMEIKKRLYEEQQNLKSIADHLPALISSVDKQLCYTFNNKEFSQWFNIPETQIVGKTILEVIGNEAFNQLKPFLNKVLQGQEIKCEITLDTQYGEIDAQTILVPCNSVNGACFHLFMLNITELKQLQNQYEFEANHDVLTALPNRRAFMKLLNTTIDTPNQYRNFAIIFLDVDFFKNINDTYGHEMGDNALIFIANTIKKVIDDKGVLARLAGDEFVILISNIDNIKQTITYICQSIIDEFNSINQIKSLKIKLSVSIGATLIDHSNTQDIMLCPTASNILSKADAAMYQAKLLGRGCFYIDA